MFTKEIIVKGKHISFFTAFIALLCVDFIVSHGVHAKQVETVDSHVESIL